MIFSLSKRIRGCPCFTLSPSFTRSSNPSPFISTVSTPTWISSSISFAKIRPQACPESAITTPTFASAGATTVSFSGSMATPSPIICCENTSSGTSSRGITLPVSPAFNSVRGSAASSVWASAPSASSTTWDSSP